MRVISLKNYCETTRVIIQLLHYHNKVQFYTNFNISQPANALNGADIN